MPHNGVSTKSFSRLVVPHFSSTRQLDNFYVIGVVII